MVESVRLSVRFSDLALMSEPFNLYDYETNSIPYVKKANLFNKAKWGDQQEVHHTLSKF